MTTTTTRILLVEDEPGYARYLREILAEADDVPHELVGAATLEEALVTLASSSFDIVLLDLGLPDADGTEALHRVAKTSPSTPIVVLSGREDLDVALATMRLGAQEYLVKGSEQPLLARAIRYAIERKRMQDTLAAAVAEAERANAVKDEFLAMLGHELRNPLAPIATALTLMRSRPGVEGVQRELDIVDRQLQHVVRLVDDLLDVSRISRGKLTLHREHCDLADIVGDGLEIARSLVESRRHTVTVDVPSGTLFIDGDRTRLAQVIANLLTNAAKYTDPGGTIVVGARQQGGLAALSVRDNGTGMPPDFLGRVFESFQQGTRTLDRASGGLGLGLSIVKSIVTLHGGTVSAASDGPGKGTEFVVHLPVDAPEAARRRGASQAPPPATTTPRQVLIVDDNEDGAEMLSAALEYLGHTTRVAYDGPSALELVKDYHPDVALLDIGLPGMNGFELARQLRAFFGDETPVLVAVTGYGQDADRKRSRDAGFDRHLVKPIDLKKFQELFASLDEAASLG